MALLGISGEIAVQESKGPGSLQMNLIDNFTISLRKNSEAI
jgi:hydroxyethylthiazole kinase-like sugar kinase family protein